MDNKPKKLYVVYYVDDQVGECLRSGVVCTTTDEEVAKKKMKEFEKKYMEDSDWTYEDEDDEFPMIVDSDGNYVEGFQVMVEETELI